MKYLFFFFGLFLFNHAAYAGFKCDNLFGKLSLDLTAPDFANSGFGNLKTQYTSPYSDVPLERTIKVKYEIKINNLQYHVQFYELVKYCEDCGMNGRARYNWKMLAHLYPDNQFSDKFSGKFAFLKDLHQSNKWTKVTCEINDAR